MRREDIQVGAKLIWRPQSGQVIHVEVLNEPWPIYGGGKIATDTKDIAYPGIADGASWMCRVRIHKQPPLMSTDKGRANRGIASARLAWRCAGSELCQYRSAEAELAGGVKLRGETAHGEGAVGLQSVQHFGGVVGNGFVGHAGESGDGAVDQF